MLDHEERQRLTDTIAQNIDGALLLRDIEPRTVFGGATADAIRQMTRETLLGTLCDHEIPAESVIPRAAEGESTERASDMDVARLEHMMNVLDAVCAPPPGERASEVMRHLRYKYQL